MHANVGDRIVIKGRRIGRPDRDAEIITVGPDGGPPYTVRWGDTGHASGETIAGARRSSWLS